MRANRVALLQRLGGGIRFDRNELAGAFGDIGTDLPLIVGMIAAAHLDVASVLIMFGALQVATGLVYRMPMPVQPLKAMAVIVITQHLAGNVLYGGGLAIGLMMLGLTFTGLIGWIGRVVPKAAVRGVQLGLGLQLALLALKDYIPAEHATGYVLAAASFVIIVALFGNRRFPPALFVVALGVGFGLAFKVDVGAVARTVGVRLPSAHAPAWSDVLSGLTMLALPQLALSIGNSILATRQIAGDLFPERPMGVRKIAFTYSLMNLVNPFLSGIPTCHGSGGIAGHYTFGARTGGSVIMYGMVFLTLGLFFSGGFERIVQVFPLPVLGVLLLFEGLALMRLARDVAESKTDLFIALLVALLAVGVQYGYGIGLVVGTALYYLTRRGLTGLTR